MVEILGLEAFFFLLFCICGLVVGLTQKGARMLVSAAIFVLLAYFLKKITYGLLFLVSMIIISEIKGVFMTERVDTRKRIRF